MTMIYRSRWLIKVSAGYDVASQDVCNGYKHKTEKKPQVEVSITNLLTILMLYCRLHIAHA